MHLSPYSSPGIEASFPLIMHWSDSESEALADEFNPQQYDSPECARVAKQAGASYMVFTAKHHDGFCMFDRKPTDYRAARRGPRRDLIGRHVEVLDSVALKVGFHFTTIDGHDPDFATRTILPYVQFPKPVSYDAPRWNEFHKDSWSGHANS